jgi:hypothetical protein
MAARLRKTHQDEVRTKIKTSQLLNRLQNHALSLIGDELSPTQMRAIEILLKKSLPDLSQVEMNVEGDVGLTIQIVRMGDGE